MEETSEHGILGRHQSCSEKKTQLLSNTIIPKVVRMETGEVIYDKVYASHRPPPKISLKHDWKRQLGSEHAQRPEVVQQIQKFPIKPINSKPMS